MVTFLYRCFDCADRLLYVGVTKNPDDRFREHRATSRWFPNVTRIEKEEFLDRKSALKAELTAIRSEGPLHNRPTSVPKSQKMAVDAHFEKLLSDIPQPAYVRGHVGRPRKANEARKVYSLSLPPELVERAVAHCGSLTAAAEAALIVWLDQPS